MLPITRIDKTKKEYSKITKRLIKKAYSEAVKEDNPIHKKNEIHKIEDETFVGLSLYNTVIWAKKYWADSLSNPSWRLYRSAIKYTAEEYLKTNRVNLEFFNKINNILDQTSGLKKSEITELKTSAKKQKRINKDDLKEIDNALKISENEYSKLTRLWLRAGIIVGLRPVEWRNAKILRSTTGPEIDLIVLNAKNTNNRAHGDYRTINLNHLKPQQIEMINQFVTSSQQISTQAGDSEEVWDKLYTGCSNLLRYTCRKLWPKRKKFPTLYSARHQFSSDLKASGMKPEEIAALMGHASDLTAQMTYGKRRYGNSARKPKVNTEEVNKVRKSPKAQKGFTFDKNAPKDNGKSGNTI